MESLSRLSNKLTDFLEEMHDKNPLNLLTFIFNISLLNNHEGSKIRRQSNECKRLLGTQLRGDIKKASDWFTWSNEGRILPSLPYFPKIKFGEFGTQALGAVINLGFIGFVGKMKLDSTAKKPFNLKAAGDYIKMGQSISSVTQPIATWFKDSSDTGKTDMQMEKQTLDGDRDAERQEVSAREQAGQEIRQKMQSIDDKDAQVFGELARG